MSGLSGLDKLAGFVVGSLKIFLLFAILIVTLSHIEFINKQMEKYMSNSKMYPIFLDVGNYIMKDSKDIIEDTNKKIKSI